MTANITPAGITDYNIAPVSSYLWINGYPLVLVDCIYCHRHHPHGFKGNGPVRRGFEYRVPDCVERPAESLGYWFEVTAAVAGRLNEGMAVAS